jgi:glutamine synthetase type III
MNNGQSLTIRHVAKYGFDVTYGVYVRIARLQDEDVPNTFQPNEVVLKAALSSFREEAIWQYHVRRARGFLLWTDESIAYIPQADGWSAVIAESTFATRLRELVEIYEPRFEAVVWSYYEQGSEVFRILPQGALQGLFCNYGARQKN